MYCNHQDFLATAIAASSSSIRALGSVIDGRNMPDQSLLARYSSRGTILRTKAWSELMITRLIHG